MKKVKQFDQSKWLIISLLGLVMSLMACAGNNEGDEGGDDVANRTNTVLPNDYRINLPQSIEGSNDGANNALITTSVQADSQAMQVQAREHSQGFLQLREMVRNLKQIVSDTELNLIIMDEILPEIRSRLASQGGSEIFLPAGSFDLTITREIESTIKSSLEELEGGDLTEELGNSIPQVGQTLPSPPLCYRERPHGLKYEVRFINTQEEGQGTEDLCPVSEESLNSFLWNEERNKIRTKMVFKNEMNQVIGRGSVLYNNVTKEMQFRHSFSGLAGVEETRVGKFKRCNDGAKNCVRIVSRFSITINDPILGNRSHTFTLKGKADNEGGFLQSRITINGDTDTHQERFNQSGRVTSQRFKNQNGNWQGPDSNFNPTADSYGNELVGDSGEVDTDNILNELNVEGF